MALGEPDVSSAAESLVFLWCEQMQLGETSLGIGVYVSLFPFGFEGLTGDFYFILFFLNLYGKLNARSWEFSGCDY